MDASHSHQQAVDVRASRVSGTVPSPHVQRGAAGACMLKWPFLLLVTSPPPFSDPCRAPRQFRADRQSRSPWYMLTRGLCTGSCPQLSRRHAADQRGWPGFQGAQPAAAAQEQGPGGHAGGARGPAAKGSFSSTAAHPLWGAQPAAALGAAGVALQLCSAAALLPSTEQRA